MVWIGRMALRGSGLKRRLARSHGRKRSTSGVSRTCNAEMFACICCPVCVGLLVELIESRAYVAGIKMQSKEKAIHNLRGMQRIHGRVHIAIFTKSPFSRKSTCGHRKCHTTRCSNYCKSQKSHPQTRKRPFQ